MGAGYPQLRSLFAFMSDLLGDPRRRQQLGPVLDQLGEFAREVCGCECARDVLPITYLYDRLGNGGVAVWQ